MIRLWEISEEIAELEAAITAIADDESLPDEQRGTKLEEAFTQWLKAGGSFRHKAEQVAAYIRHQEALAEARRQEAKRIRTLADQAEKQASRLRGYLLNQMLAAGQTRIEGAKIKVSLRKKPPHIRLKIDPFQLPPEYVKVEYTPKLAAIKKMLKTGNIDWAELTENTEYALSIK